MKQGSGLNKISQIISLSNNYLSHRKNLTKIKGLVDHSTNQRNNDIEHYLSRQITYKVVRKQINNKLLTKQNEKIVQRLTNITDRRNQSRVSTRSNQSMQRTLSDQVLAYKTRKNFLKTREVQQENIKISQRIKKAHFKNGLAPHNYTSSRKQGNSYKKVHSRFSQRSQSQMRQILDGMNYDNKKIPFLPVLKSRRYSKN